MAIPRTKACDGVGRRAVEAIFAALSSSPWSPLLVGALRSSSSRGRSTPRSRRRPAWTGYGKGKLGMGRLVTAGCSEGGSEVRRDWLRRRQGRRKGIGKRQITGSGTCTISTKID
uniref:Uncharacterized protein n=1 Tax=Oryza barthii TaxID=65489 RepID=A0A0D3G424_9ORYZ